MLIALPGAYCLNIIRIFLFYGRLKEPKLLTCRHQYGKAIDNHLFYTAIVRSYWQ